MTMWAIGILVGLLTKMSGGSTPNGQLDFSAPSQSALIVLFME